MNFRSSLLAVLIFAVAAPAGPADTPKQAIENAIAELRKTNLIAAYGYTSGEMRKLMDKEIHRLHSRVGLAAEATVVDVLEALEKDAASDDRVRVELASFRLEIDSIKAKENTADAAVRMGPGKKLKKFTLKLRKVDGQWRIDSVDMTKARSTSNEASAHATLRNVTSAQAQFQAIARADVNSNGVGEFGTFLELSGAVGIRGGEAKLNPPVLSSAFRTLKDGVVTRSGYHFRIFLADKNGKPVPEGTKFDQIDTELSENVWCAYAWPVEYGKTGKRTYFVNQLGDVLAVDHAGYSGKNGPAGNAVFSKAEKGRMDGRTAQHKVVTNDGLAWKQVG